MDIDDIDTNIGRDTGINKDICRCIEKYRYI